MPFSYLSGLPYTRQPNRENRYFKGCALIRLLVLASLCSIVLTSYAAPNSRAPTNSVAEKEVAIGRKAHEELAETTHFYQDETINAYVNEVGQKLAANSDWPEIEYHFFIIDSPDINAFALPGGYIYINRGLLSYLTSEAQLAGVLAHEIAHVTRRHASRRNSKVALGNAAAFIATIATLNSNVGEAIQLETSAFASGYGRDMELEADEYGASYLYRSGYDPVAVMEVLSVLKDHERFSLLKSREAGQDPKPYHGVFSSHPRNDQRLQEVISQAGELPPGEDFRGRDVYRQILDGMVFGPNDTTTAPPGYDRYATKSLGVTFVYPENWARTTEGQLIVLTSNDSDLRVEISVAKPTQADAAPEDLLKSRYQVEKLKDSKPVHTDENRRDEGGYALLNLDSGNKRVAVVKSGAYEYYFEAANPVPLTKEQDQQVIELIQSFRKSGEADFPPDNMYSIYFRRLEPGETFASLAANRAIGRYTEEQLRLINGYYPSGEAEPGTWIKMVK